MNQPQTPDNEVARLRDDPKAKEIMNTKYKIIKTKSDKYFIQYKFLWFWLTHRPMKSPTYMESFHLAETELRKIKRYQTAKQEVVHEE